MDPISGMIGRLIPLFIAWMLVLFVSETRMLPFWKVVGYGACIALVLTSLARIIGDTRPKR